MIEGFAISVSIEVRWRDIDALGHVNNAVYFTYLEIARTAYLERVFRLSGLEAVPILLASARCDYLSPVTQGETVEAGIRVASAGNTSFDFEYELVSQRDGRVVARGYTTQVLYDHRLGQKMAVSEAWLDQVETAEGRRPPRRG